MKWPQIDPIPAENEKRQTSDLRLAIFIEKLKNNCNVIYFTMRIAYFLRVQILIFSFMRNVISTLWDNVSKVNRLIELWLPVLEYIVFSSHSLRGSWEIGRAHV